MIKRVVTDFLAVIALSIIISSLNIGSHLLTNSEYIWDLFRRLFVLVVAIVGFALYLRACLNLATVKGYAKPVGLVSLIPIIGMILLVRLPDKTQVNPPSFASNFRHLGIFALLSAILPFAIVLMTPSIVFQIEIRQIAQESGFSLQETKAILQALKKQQGVEIVNHIFIRKLADDEAEISDSYYCGPLCGSGVTYLAKKVNGKWMIEKRSSWIS